MHASPSSTPTHTLPLHDASNANPSSSPLVTPDVVDVPFLTATPPVHPSLDVAPPSLPSSDVAMAEHPPSQPNGVDVDVAPVPNVDTSDDTRMADADDIKPNGVHLNGDAPTPSVAQLTIQTPEPNALDTSPSDTTAVVRPVPSDIDDADKPPPAKRARRLSDPEQASLVHVSAYNLLHRSQYSFPSSLLLPTAPTASRIKHRPCFPPHRHPLPSVSNSTSFVFRPSVSLKRARMLFLSSTPLTTSG